jgi:hypothetical protein
LPIAGKVLDNFGGQISEKKLKRLEPVMKRPRFALSLLFLAVGTVLVPTRESGSFPISGDFRNPERKQETT